MQSKNRSAYPPTIQRPVAVKIHHRDKTYACEAIAFLPFLLPSFPPNPPTPPLIFLPSGLGILMGGLGGTKTTHFQGESTLFLPETHALFVPHPIPPHELGREREHPVKYISTKYILIVIYPSHRLRFAVST